MLRLFINLYLFIVVALVGLSALLEALIFEDVQSEKENIQLAKAVAQISTYESIAEFASKNQIDIQLMTTSDIAFPASQQQTLASGEVLLSYDDHNNTHMYVGYDENAYLHFRLPAQNQDSQFLFYSVSFFLLLGLFIALWSYPLWRDIRRLEVAARSLQKDGSLPLVEVSPTSAVSSINQAFKTLSEKVHALVTSQRELSSAVAHEFRTPLARIKFGLEQMPDQDSKCSMKEDVIELENLIQEMLEFSQSEHNQPELSIAEIPLFELLQQQVNQLPPSRVQQLKIVVTPCEHTLIADGHFTERAVANLLNNACKYATSQVLLSCPQSNGYQCIIVEDDGPGVAPEKRGEIFQPFYRPDPSRARHHGGAGLGLAIVNRVMSWHEGKCWVESSDLGGAKFVLQFPVKIQD